MISMPARGIVADGKALNPGIGLASRLMARWSCSTMLSRSLTLYPAGLLPTPKHKTQINPGFDLSLDENKRARQGTGGLRKRPRGHHTREPCKPLNAQARV
jgi:hypothetical protein